MSLEESTSVEPSVTPAARTDPQKAQGFAKGLHHSARSDASNVIVRFGQWILPLSPIVCTLVIMGVLTWIMQRFFSCPSGLNSCVSDVDRAIKDIITKSGDPSEVQKLARVSGRIYWTVWSLLYVLMLMVASVVMVVVVTRNNNRTRLRSHWGLGVILILVLVGVLASLYSFPGLHSLTVAPFISVIDANETIEKWNIGGWSDWFELASYIIAGLLVVFSAMLLHLANDIVGTTAKDKLGERLSSLAAVRDDLNMLLYSGALLLVVGVIHIQTIQGWAAAFFNNDDNTLAAVGSLNSTVITFSGLSCSVLLAAAYIPSVLTLMYFVRKDNPDQTLLEKHHFNSNLQGLLTHIATILAPLLTVPLTGVIGQIFKIGS